MKPPNKLQESENCKYNITCECGKVYREETSRPLQTRIHEHQRSTTKGELQNSTTAEYSRKEKQISMGQSAEVQ